jgi:hypothetical protein
MSLQQWGDDATNLHSLMATLFTAIIFIKKSRNFKFEIMSENSSPLTESLARVLGQKRNILIFLNPSSNFKNLFL